MVVLLGDLNVDMLKCTPHSKRLQTAMLDDLGMRRLDVEGPNAYWVTHVRRASHLDCIALRASCEHEVVDTWNRQWARVKKGTQDSVDHKSLGLSLNLEHGGTRTGGGTAMVERGAPSQIQVQTRYRRTTDAIRDGVCNDHRCWHPGTC